jgi:hypothetical protein
MVTNPIVGVRFTPEEVELLDAIAAKEERKRSDVVRRAVRAYAQALGVELKPKRPVKTKR